MAEKDLTREHFMATSTSNSYSVLGYFIRRMQQTGGCSLKNQSNINRFAVNPVPGRLLHDSENLGLFCCKICLCASKTFVLTFSTVFQTPIQMNILTYVIKNFNSVSFFRQSAKFNKPLFNWHIRQCWTKIIMITNRVILTVAIFIKSAWLVEKTLVVQDKI